MLSGTRLTLARWPGNDRNHGNFRKYRHQAGRPRRQAHGGSLGIGFVVGPVR
jgi:hypothetical protein